MITWHQEHNLTFIKPWRKQHKVILDGQGQPKVKSIIGHVHTPTYFTYAKYEPDIFNTLAVIKDWIFITLKQKSSNGFFQFGHSVHPN